MSNLYKSEAELEGECRMMLNWRVIWFGIHIAKNEIINIFLQMTMHKLSK